jgi:hypothetical protein
MPGKSAAFENALLKLIFNGNTISNIAEDAAVAPLDFFYVALHSADPTDQGTQASNEVNYTGYARMAIPRDPAGFVVAGSSMTLATNVDFGQCVAGLATATHVSIGTQATGAGMILYSGTIAPNISISQGVIPRLTTATVLTEG